MYPTWKNNLQRDNQLTAARCADGLSVETTAWESWKARQESANGRP